MISIFNLLLICVVVVLAGALAWLGSRYLNAQKEVEQLTQKIGRIAKKQRQRKVQPKKPPFEQVLNFISGGVVVSDRDGNLVWHNAEAADILDLDPAEASHSSIMSILSQLPMLISNSIGESEVAPAEFDFNNRRIQGTMYVLYGKDGMDQGTVAVLNDVTTWHAALLAKQRQLDEINHELRQRLTSMGSFTELLEASDGENKAWLPKLHETVGRVTQLIETTMQIAAVKGDNDPANHVRVDVKRTIKETIEWLKPDIQAKQIYLKQQVEEDLSPVMAQQVHIQTVLKELLTNSIQFNRAGGMVQIKAASQYDEDSQSEFLILNVADDGAGIALDDQKKIFDVFYRPNVGGQSKGRNIGVGLAIVHAIVEAYNGRIWFNSKEGQGTAFTILLPTGIKHEKPAELSAEIEAEDDDEFAWIKD